MMKTNGDNKMNMGDGEKRRMKIGKREIMHSERVEKMKIRVVYVQLTLMLFSIFSFPYVLGEAINYDEGYGSDDNVLFSMFSSVMSFVTKPMIPLVSAAGVQGCCSEANDGSRCVFTDSASCSGDFAGGAVCESVSFCQKGCCYNDSTGIYDEGV